VTNISLSSAICLSSVISLRFRIGAAGTPAARIISTASFEVTVTDHFSISIFKEAHILNDL
jgi:hypothetical protein